MYTHFCFFNIIHFLLNIFRQALHCGRFGRMQVERKKLAMEAGGEGEVMNKEQKSHEEEKDNHDRKKRLCEKNEKRINRMNGERKKKCS